MRRSLTLLSLGQLEWQYIIFFILPQIRNNHRALKVFSLDTFGPKNSSLMNVVHTFEYHDGDCRYDLLVTEFFGDPSRSGRFYPDADKYANFAITFTKYIFQRYVCRSVKVCFQLLSLNLVHRPIPAFR